MMSRGICRSVGDWGIDSSIRFYIFGLGQKKLRIKMPAQLSFFSSKTKCVLAACQYLTTAINSGITQPAFASQTLHDLTTYAADTLVSDFIDNCRSVGLDPTAISGDALHDVLEGEILRGINKHVADSGYPSRTQFNNSTARMESPLLREMIRAREQGQ